MSTHQKPPSLTMVLSAAREHLTDLVGMPENTVLAIEVYRLVPDNSEDMIPPELPQH